MIHQNFFSKIALTVMASGGYFFLPVSSADAASISYGAWTLNSPTISSTTYGSGSGQALPNRLLATARAESQLLNPLSWLSENANVTVSSSGSFTVTPGSGEKMGQEVDGRLQGSLIGFFIATGLGGIPGLTNSYKGSVTASVDVPGFASWNSPGTGTSFDGGFLIPSTDYKEVDIPFDIGGTKLIIGIDILPPLNPTGYSGGF
jgi:hypothetical protein